MGERDLELCRYYSGASQGTQLDPREAAEKKHACLDGGLLTLIHLI
jgi:hypothetical protein